MRVAIHECRKVISLQDNEGIEIGSMTIDYNDPKTPFELVLESTWFNHVALKELLSNINNIMKNYKQELNAIT